MGPYFMGLPDSKIKVAINGKKWNVLRTSISRRSPDGQRIYGECDSPNTPNKTITVDKRLSGELELDTILHELLHAACWEVFDEEFVDGTATSLARVLWRLGYRKTTL